MKLKKEEQKKQFELVKKKVREVKKGKKKPLYRMLEESFDQVQAEEEKERQKKLAKIRLAKRPIDINKLQEHALKHDQFIMRMQFRKANEANKSMI